MTEFVQWLRSYRMEVFIGFVLVANLIGAIYEIGYQDFENINRFKPFIIVLIKIGWVIFHSLIFSILQFIGAALFSIYYYIIKWIYYKLFFAEHVSDEDLFFIFVFWVLTLVLVNMIFTFTYQENILFFFME